MKKLAPFLILILLALLVIVIKRCKGEDVITSKRTTASTKKVAKRNHGFDRTFSYVEYTAHAKCRMQCRHISQQDIEDIMRSGDINYSKSDVNEAPCPVYAVQGYTRTNEHLRVIFGQCDYKTKVITCYNLDQDFACDCPGDEKKTYQ